MKPRGNRRGAQPGARAAWGEAQKTQTEEATAGSADERQVDEREALAKAQKTKAAALRLREEQEQIDLDAKLLKRAQVSQTAEEAATKALEEARQARASAKLRRGQAAAEKGHCLQQALG